MFAKFQPKAEAKTESHKTESHNAAQPLNELGQKETATGIPLSAQEMLQLQKSIGNMAVQRMLQGSLPKSKASEAQGKQYDNASTGKDEEQTNEGQDEQTEEEAQQLSIEDILAMQPPESKRTREEMERDIRLAQSTVDKVMAECDTLEEISAYFPLLQLRFGLREIGFKDLGTPTAQVAMEINPKGACLFAGNNNYALNKGASHGLADKQDVTFKTGKSSTGHTWAKEMTANVLGPNHPQGFGPTDQRALMRYLPTNRKNHPGLENRYIRGHLLNDSLGGPGLEQNLFPITEKANKDHEQFVESQVKKWVNQLGYFVYYHVEVKNINQSLNTAYTDDDRNYVDADLHCEAYVLSVNGGRSKLTHYVNCVIKSKHGAVQGPQDMGVATAAGPDDADASHKKFVTNKWIELSVTKNKGEKGFDSVIDEVADGFMEFYNEVVQIIDKQQTVISTISQAVAPNLSKVTPQNLGFVLKAIVMDSKGETEGVAKIQDSNFGKVGPWNHITNELSKKKDDIADMFDAMTHVIDEYKKLNAAEIDWLSQNKYSCYAKLVFNKMLDQYPNVDDHIAEMKKKLYESGWKAARANNNKLLISDAYQEGHQDYLDGFARAESGSDCNKDMDGFKAGHQDYLDGLSCAQAGNVAQFNYLSYKAAFDEYHDGLLKARQGLNPANQNKARKAAHDEYKSGWQDNDGDEMYQQFTEAYKAGHNDYEAGLTDARSGAGAQRGDHAYKLAFDDYDEGWLDISNNGANAPLRNGRAYEAGFNDYDSGMTDAENGVNGPPAGHHAYQVGFNDYESGLADAQASLVKQLSTKAYVLAYDDYCDGFDDAQSDNGQNANTAAYESGYDDYMDGLNDASNQAGYQNGNQAYMAGYLEYEDGKSRAEMDREPDNDTYAYMEGYDSVDNSAKKQKTTR